MEKYTLKSEQIKKIRKSLKLTQVQFGEIIGVAKTAVIDWEKGRRTPHPVFRNIIVNLAKGKDIGFDGDQPTEQITELQDKANQLNKLVAELQDEANSLNRLLAELQDKANSLTFTITKIATIPASHPHS